MKEKIKEFSERLLSLPNEIATLQESLIEFNDELQKVDNEISERTSEIKTIINNALDDNGKKLYSNAEMRESAFISDSKNDILLPSLYVEHSNIQKRIQKVKIGIENLSNYQRNVRTLVAYMAEQTID
jgi:predicted  nucleic acid-binding Zn-ribbon protein